MKKISVLLITIVLIFIIGCNTDFSKNNDEINNSIVDNDSEKNINENNNHNQNDESSNEIITSKMVVNRLSSLSVLMNEVKNNKEIDDKNLEEEIKKIEEDILNMSLIEFSLFSNQYTTIGYKTINIIKFDDNLIIISEILEETINNVAIFENVIPTNESIQELGEGMDVYQMIKITGFPTACSTSSSDKRFHFHTDTNDSYKVVFDDDFKFIKIEPWIGDIENMAQVVSDECDPENISKASNVELIKEDMTFDEVIKILGKPIAQFGSGAIWYGWNLDDQTKLFIQFKRISNDNNLYVLRIIIKE